MEILKLQARERGGAGKSYTRKARAQGWIPAVYYGRGLEPKKIEVSHKEFEAVVRARKHTHLFDLGLSGEGYAAEIREVQRHVLKDSVYFHLDFINVDLSKKITVNVPVELTGTSVGVKDDSGVLQQQLKSVAIECLPIDRPEKIYVDISALKIGDNILVRNVEVPNAVIKRAPEDVVATVAPPARVEKAAEAEEPAKGKKGKK